MLSPRNLTEPLRLAELRRAPSAWQFYFREWIERWQLERRTNLNIRKLRVAEAAKEARQQYWDLTTEQREPYERREHEALAAYTDGVKDPVGAFTSMILELMPDIGPTFVRSYVHKHYGTFRDRMDDPVVQFLLEDASMPYPKPITKLPILDDATPSPPLNHAASNDEENRTLRGRLVSLTQKIVKTVKDDFDRICNDLEENIRRLFE
ncbi:hypothetical protein BD410DRAFT_846100 [Rickenella mellea]|uniref:Uncharacterized protein n=1 Tax=Rickenella mellea TaxID=50990 RepID=A0A4Y7PGB3_9AGAM|nr:hypothetical protein BD410DRAFT_846100 [Rickenella mellea]